MEMNLGAAGLRILAILPVDDENAHLHPPHAAGQRVEHSVHELRAFDRSVSFREVHGFLNDDPRRRFALPTGVAAFGRCRSATAMSCAPTRCFAWAIAKRR